MPNEAELPEFQRRQYAFAAHIRNPDQAPRPADVEDRRMAVYRELFYNNVEGFLANGFPVLRSILDDTRWHALVRDFFARHRARSPLFRDIPREFLAWLEQSEARQPDGLPFLRELAHYEWVELALSVSTDEPDPESIDSAGDLLAGRPVVSPLAWPLGYRFPVHRIGPGFMPDSPGKEPTHLLVWRDADDEIRFLELNPVSARLIGLLIENETRSGRDLLEDIATELRHPEPAVVVEGGREILEDWRRRHIVLGTAI